KPDFWLELSTFILDASPDRRHINISLDDFRSSLALALRSFEKLRQEYLLDSRYFYHAGRLGNTLRSVGVPLSGAFIEEKLKTSLTLSPKRVDIYYELAELERSKGNYDAMLEYLNQALAINENVPQTHFNLGIAYASVGRLEDAIKEVDMAETLGYRGWQSNYNEVTFIIDIYIMAKRYDEKLIELYKIAINLNPKDPQLYGSLAFLLKELGRPDEAAVYAKKVMELDPSREWEVKEFLESLVPR
ncbi:MAG: tetratricopeptide repeat protein, partial [Candidatus Paceibacteria bacterium]